MLEFIQKHISLSVEEIMRCIQKSTIIKQEEDMLFLGNDEIIFFFIIIENKRKTKEFMAFYKECYPFMKNRYFYSKDIGNYKDRCVLAQNQDAANPEFLKYKWL